ncbi:MAG: hypothetical protein Alpg2KO_32040 [Alphaproteobacteria bacterium]
MAVLDRHSRIIRQLRFALPLVVAGSLGAKLNRPEFDATRSIAATASDGETEMVEAEFFTLDDKDRPISVRATRVRQSGENRDLVHVDSPKADILLPKEGWIGINAKSGIYDQSSRSLSLLGGVEVHHGDGWEIETPTAVIELSNRKASGDETVAAQGPLGHVTGEGFEIDGTGGVLTITGKSRLVLYPDDNWSLD